MKKVIIFLILNNIIFAGGQMIEKSLKYKSTDKNGIDLNYLLYLPANFSEVKTEFPLVLFLHGAGERGNDIENIKVHGIPKIIQEGNSFPFICIAPQCPSDGYWDRPEYVNTLLSFVAKVRDDFGLKSKKIYGTGLSMGGLGVLAMAIQDPGFFSAIIPVCGGADVEQMNRLGDLPIWLFHGDRDKIHPVDNSINIYQQLQSINKNVHLTIYGNVGHDSWTMTYENDAIYDWLMKFGK